MSNADYESTRMYEAQARIISGLNEKLRHAQLDYQRLKDQNIAAMNDAMFYRVMVAAIQKHEILQEEWMSFIALMRLHEPDLDNQMKKQLL